MTNAAFNTYRFFETLEHSREFSPAQVKDLTKALDVSQTDADLVTNAELRANMAEVKAEFAKVRTEMEQLRTEFRTEFADVRAEFRTEFAKVRTEIATTANRTILCVVGVNVALYSGLFAMMAKGFHWY